MVGNQVLGPLSDPGEVAYTEFGTSQRRSEHQPRRVGERTGAPGQLSCGGRVKPNGPEDLGLVEVEAEKVAAVIIHSNILTYVAMCRLYAR